MISLFLYLILASENCSDGADSECQFCNGRHSCSWLVAKNSTRHFRYFRQAFSRLFFNFFLAWINWIPQKNYDSFQWIEILSLCWFFSVLHHLILGWMTCKKAINCPLQPIWLEFLSTKSQKVTILCTADANGPRTRDNGPKNITEAAKKSR